MGEVKGTEMKAMDGVKLGFKVLFYPSILAVRARDYMHRKRLEEEAEIALRQEIEWEYAKQAAAEKILRKNGAKR